MTAANDEGKQPLLFPVGDLGPPNDPVGAALGLEDDEDPAQAWEEVMDMFAKLAVKSYYESQRRKRAGS